MKINYLPKTISVILLIIVVSACSIPTEPVSITSTPNSTRTDSVSITTPLPVLSSSYENFKTYVVLPTNTDQSVVPTCQRGEYKAPASNGRGYADFLQDGTITMVDLVIGPPMGVHTDAGIICFWKRNSNGKWEDITAKFLDDDRGCSGGANKSLIADYNRDNKPDVFFLCTGTKWAPDGSMLGYQPGGYSVWIMSQPGGKYKTLTMNYPAYAHGGAAGDVNGDKFPDIVFTNGGVIEVAGHRQGQYITVLLNDGTGNFNRRDDFIVIPDSLQQQNITAVELIDVDDDGTLDLLVGSGNYRTFVLWGERNAGFPNKRVPARIPFGQPEKNYNGAHTFHKIGRYLYSWNVINSSIPSENGNALQRINLDTWQDEIIWKRTRPYLIDGWWNVNSWGQIRLYEGKFVHDFVSGLTIEP